MRIAVLGTGMVGRSIATKLASLGHEVMMGSRTADNESAAEWVASGERSGPVISTSRSFASDNPDRERSA